MKETLAEFETRIDAATDAIEQKLIDDLDALYAIAIALALKAAKATLDRIKAIEQEKPGAGEDEETRRKKTRVKIMELIRRTGVFRLISAEIAACGPEARRMTARAMESIRRVNLEEYEDGKAEKPTLYRVETIEQEEPGAWENEEAMRRKKQRLSPFLLVALYNLPSPQTLIERMPAQTIKITRRVNLEEYDDVRIKQRLSPFSLVAFDNLSNPQTIIKQLQNELAIHLRGKRDIGDLTDRIKRVMGISHHRAATIARTERTRAQNQARHEAILNENRRHHKKKTREQWIARHDGKTRSSHAAMSGQVRYASEYFVSGAGNRLLYPGDPNAPASEVINCRCYIRRVKAKE